MPGNPASTGASPAAAAVLPADAEVPEATPALPEATAPPSPTSSKIDNNAGKFGVTALDAKMQARQAISITLVRLVICQNTDIH